MYRQTTLQIKGIAANTPAGRILLVPDESTLPHLNTSRGKHVHRGMYKAVPSDIPFYTHYLRRHLRHHNSIAFELAIEYELEGPVLRMDTRWATLHGVVIKGRKHGQPVKRLERMFKKITLVGYTLDAIHSHFPRESVVARCSGVTHVIHPVR